MDPTPLLSTLSFFLLCLSHIYIILIWNLWQYRYGQQVINPIGYRSSGCGCSTRLTFDSQTWRWLWLFILDADKPMESVNSSYFPCLGSWETNIALKSQVNPVQQKKCIQCSRLPVVFGVSFLWNLISIQTLYTFYEWYVRFLGTKQRKLTRLGRKCEKVRTSTNTVFLISSSLMQFLELWNRLKRKYLLFCKGWRKKF